MLCYIKYMAQWVCCMTLIMQHIQAAEVIVKEEMAITETTVGETGNMEIDKDGKIYE